MRIPVLASTVMAALAAATLVPAAANAQAQPPQQAPAAKPGPYKPVPVIVPVPYDDASFAAFRAQLGQVARRKDRAALARMVAPSFFWVPEDTDLADKSKPVIDNLAKAITLDGADAFGWNSLVAYAGEKTAHPDSQRKGVICAPAEPGYDDSAATELANATQTIASDWMYPLRDGLEVRSAARKDAPVIERLGLHLVHVLPDESPSAAVTADFVRVATPSGKVGFASADALRDIAQEQLCYVKEAGGWKIAGFYGGEPSQ
jgi:hypothetical protein